MKNAAAVLVIVAGMSFLNGCAAGPSDELIDSGLPAGLSMGLESAANWRDLGGYVTENGQTVLSGIIYRSNTLSTLTSEDQMKITELDVMTTYDLRTDAEVQSDPDKIPPGISYVRLNVLADATSAAPAQLLAMMSDPETANEELGGGKIDAAFIEGYRGFITLPSAQSAYGRLFHDLTDSDKTPVVFHCTTGKDRTGWAAAAFLTLLGVSRETVMEDFLRSNEYILPLYTDLIDQFEFAGGDRAIPEAIFGVKESYLNASFDEVAANYGSIEVYFDKALGIDAAEQQVILDRFLSE